MRRFLLKILSFSLLPIASLLGVFMLEDGTSDPFYQRFVTPSQTSLIIGSSRAAQGIKPSSINSALGLVGDSKIFNYSFTIMHSPFGEIYSKRIFQKLNRNPSAKGIFILAVDPWMISSSKKDPNNVELYSEKGLFLEKLEWVNGSINLQYFLNHYTNSFYEILLRKFVNVPFKLHRDGWLEIELDEGDLEYERRLKRKLIEYRMHLNNLSFSNTRFRSFLKLIKGLQKCGDVYLVRLPVDEEILEIENQYMPEFNTIVLGTSNDLSVPYLDFSSRSKQFKYTDGNHLQRGSAKIVSLEIADWLDVTRKITDNK